MHSSDKPVQRKLARVAFRLSRFCDWLLLPGTAGPASGL